MTHADDIADDFEPAPPDKLFMHYRRQLSAMLDGELSPDEAKFMLRRLQHDSELAACWERWQVCGDVLRGRGHALLPTDFASRVARAIKHDGKATAGTTTDAAGARGSRRRAMLRGSAALAASVAVVAFFVARQLPGDAGPAASGAVADPVATELAPSPPADTPDPSTFDQAAAALAATAAVAEVPRRAAERRSRGQGQRAASRVQQRIAQQAPVMVAASQAGLPAAAASFAPAGASDPDPFATRTEGSPRPWPRAILPGLAVPAAGSFVASHGDAGDGVSSGFHPFEPRLPSRDPVFAVPRAEPQPEPGAPEPQASPAAEDPSADGMEPQP